MVTTGTKVVVEKGCKARNVAKGSTAVIRSVEELGPDYSYSVRVTLYFLNSFMSGKTVSFYVCHKNRLNDVSVRMNDGRPEHTIVVRVKPKLKE